MALNGKDENRSISMVEKCAKKPSMLFLADALFFCVVTFVQQF